jgi:hypothetical protein
MTGSTVLGSTGFPPVREEPKIRNASHLSRTYKSVWSIMSAQTRIHTDFPTPSLVTHCNVCKDLDDGLREPSEEVALRATPAEKTLSSVVMGGTKLFDENSIHGKVNVRTYSIHWKVQTIP